MGSLYLWVKVLHIFAVIAWMAGLLYLYRLFIYHVQHSASEANTKMLEVMERRLLRAITVPAMLFVWVAGFWMLFLNPAFMSQGWLHSKLLLVVLMSGFTMYGARIRRQLAEGENKLTTFQLRVLNEVPTVLLLLILILVVLKPY
jgi:putative membrane protein